MSEGKAGNNDFEYGVRHHISSTQYSNLFQGRLLPLKVGRISAAAFPDNFNELNLLLRRKINFYELGYLIKPFII